MSESKNFIKSAVGILLVVAVCFVAVTIYKKGNASINSSLKDYDDIVSGFSNAKLKVYDDTTVKGSQIIDLIKTLTEEDGISIKVKNGYLVSKSKEAQEYTYPEIHASDSKVLTDISDSANEESYINPSSSFMSKLEFDENGEVAAVSFEQKK